jgi:hypothetical protein
MIAAFTIQEAGSKLSQLRVDDGEQPVAGVNVSAAPIAEPARDLQRQGRPQPCR